MRYLDKSQLAERLTERMAGDIADGRVGGAGIGIVQDGDEVFHRYFGVKSTASGCPLADSGDTTVFRLASMTKPITAVACMIQVSRGRLSLDEPVSGVFPALADLCIGKATPDGTGVEAVRKHTVPITPRMLLNHTSGIGTGVTGGIQMAAESWASPEEAVAGIGNSVLEFEPGTRELYSPVWAFDVLACLTERLSGQSFDRFLRENLLDPCGMTDTTFAPTADQWERMITMHTRVKEEGQEHGQSVDAPTHPGCVFEKLPPSRCSGGAGLASTLSDYVRFAEMLCHGGVTESGKRLLPPEAVAAMGRPTIPLPLRHPTETWGLGMRVITSDSYVMPKGCFGWSGAYGTHFFVDPVNRLSAVYMKNSRYDGGAGAVTSAHFEQDVYACLTGQER